MKSEGKRKASAFWAVSMMTMTLTCNFMAVVDCVYFAFFYLVLLLLSCFKQIGLI